MQIAKITYYKGKGIFEGCVKLKVVDIGNFSVVPDSTFKDCKALEEVKQPVGNIHYEAFFGCISLKRIILSQNCQHIGMSAFENCCNLEVLKKTETEQHNLGEILDRYERAGKRNEHHRREIAKGKMQTASYLLEECRVTLFRYDYILKMQRETCSFVYQVNIHPKAFNGCSKLKNFYGDEVCVTGEKTFANCSSLQAVFLRLDVSKYISLELLQTFENCEALYYCDIETYYNLMNYSNSAQEYWITTDSRCNEVILKQTFKNCHQVVFINLGLSKVEEIIIHNETFSECKNLVYINTRRNQINRIEDNAFFNCNSLKLCWALWRTELSKHALLGSNLKTLYGSRILISQ
ncbi:leucine-rich repeat protein [Prevotella pallens]|uniref:leucine-rich repeat protein n=1 Tax=Prevotella pallens TaxID=60133 RepID=UPI001CB446A5|nr:leucine-rich repeat protein [Prevotella pallens]MBF1463440.1 leucine-rich repeat protein [Prevotella pallens]